MVEAKVLQKYLHKLASTLDPVVISTALHAEGIVDERVWEEARLEGACYDKCLKVLGALVRAVKASPASFDTFCLILEDQVVTKDIAKELTGMSHACDYKVASRYLFLPRLRKVRSIFQSGMQFWVIALVIGMDSAAIVWLCLAQFIQVTHRLVSVPDPTNPSTDRF